MQKDKKYAKILLFIQAEYTDQHAIKVFLLYDLWALIYLW